MFFSDLTEEDNTSKTTTAPGDGTVKDKFKIIDWETMNKFEKHNKMVRGHLLNDMTNPFVDLFVTFKSAKIIWEKLEVKYGAGDIGKKKYVVGEWLLFHIIDDKPIMDHVHVFDNLCAEALSENRKTCKIL